MNRGYFVPLWQEVSGLDPVNEDQLDLEARDNGIRRLLHEVDRIARIEFEHAEKSPPGERSVFWDPLAAVCFHLQISRTRLSRYARLLTGLRAHELMDRFKAATLPARMRAALAWLRPALDQRAASVRARLHEPDFAAAFTAEIIAEVKAARSGVYAVEWAVKLGFPNLHRVKRACVIAHGIGIDQMEATLVTTMVQKFLSELTATSPAETEATQAAPPEAAPPAPPAPTVPPVNPATNASSINKERRRKEPRETALPSEPRRELAAS